MHTTRKFFRLIFGVMLILLALMPVGTAAAEPPVIVPGLIYDQTGPFEFKVCPGLDIWYRETLTYSDKLFFDNDGNLTRVKEHFIGTDTFYLPEKPDFVVIANGNAMFEYDVAAGEYKASGVALRLTVPGEGTVLMLTGFWTSYPSAHLGGLDFTQRPDDVKAFCALWAND
jgi:hypothetical protein